jgi:Flp pilus assembly protein TadD
VGAPVRLIAAALAVAIGCLGCASYRGARLYQEGSAALDRGEAERAVSDLEHAARLVPQASEIQNHLGLAYAAAGRDADALNAFRNAVALDCDNEAAAHNLRRAESARAVLQP